MSFPLAPLIVFFIVGFALACARPRYIQRRGFSIVRILFPSWRFFEEPTPLPEISYRLLGPSESSEWRGLLSSPPRSARTLLYNPRGNLALAEHTLLQQIESDIADLPPDTDAAEFERSVSFRLAENLVRFVLSQSAGIPDGSSVEFRLTRPAPTGEPEAFLISRPLQLSSRPS